MLHKKSNVFGRVPSASTLGFGEIAVNYNEKEPFLAIKTSGETNNFEVVKISSDKIIEQKINDAVDKVSSELNELADIVSQNELVTADSLTELNDAINYVDSKFSEYTTSAATLAAIKVVNDKTDALSNKLTKDYATSASVVSAITETQDKNPFEKGEGVPSAIFVGSIALGHYSTSIGFHTTASNFSSHAEGNSTTASGAMSHAEGWCTTAYGNFSHAEGNSSNKAPDFIYNTEGNVKNVKEDTDIIATWEGNGDNTTKFSLAKGDSSHVEGRDNLALGVNSHAEGVRTKALGDNSHAEGAETTAESIHSHSEGAGTTAAEGASHAEGCATRTEGWASHAEGQSTIAYGQASHAEGDKTTAYGGCSHAEGYYTTAYGDDSHAEGTSTKKASEYIYNDDGSLKSNDDIIAVWNDNKFSLAKGVSSHVEGEDNLALGVDSHAEGWLTTALGHVSHAEGHFTIASGNYSHTEGYCTIASGSSSHAEGANTKASGNYSHAEGEGTIANNIAEHASGKYNVSILKTADNTTAEATLFSIGMGTSDENRKNAIEVKQNGDIYIEGVEGKIQDKLNSIEENEEIVASALNSLNSDIKELYKIIEDGGGGVGNSVAIEAVSQVATDLFNFKNEVRTGITVHNSERIAGQTIDEIVSQLGTIGGINPEYDSDSKAYVVGVDDDGNSYYSDVYMSGNTLNAPNGFFQQSDENLKIFISDIEVDLEKITQLPKKYFMWLDKRDENIHLGTSAQAVQELYPEIVRKDKNGNLTVDYSKLSVIALRAIDVLNEERKQMKADIAEIKTKLGL